MKPQNITESIRIDKDLLDSIKKIIPLTGQTVKGYVEIHIKKQIEKDLLKMSKKEVSNV
jgi:hypothetical protein